jgi:hypothetical protein
MSSHAAPFGTNDPDRLAIWQMLVPRDTDAYLSRAWPAVADDFLEEGFFGIDARRDPNPEHWRIAFPALAPYRAEWLRQAEQTERYVDVARARAAFLDAVTLENIQIDGSFALAHKIFNGQLPNRDGTHETLDWQTLYVCRRHSGRWKISSFVGYMPRSAAIGVGTTQVTQR